MTTKTLPEVPVGMRRVYRRFERWRKFAPRRACRFRRRCGRQPRRSAREHGVFRTAKALRLEYGKLKRMVKSAKPAVRRAPAPPSGLLGVGRAPTVDPA